MLLVVSPAKTLDFDTPPTTDQHSLPRWLERSAELIGLLRQYSPAQLAALMDISDKLAVLNVGRYQDWQIDQIRPGRAKQAVLAFMGDVYEGLAACQLDEAALRFAQQHLRILSGLYGVLRPLDLMLPYRLEMGTRLANPAGSNLYAFWGDQLTHALREELAAMAEPVLVNVASDEYFKVVSPRKLGLRVVTPVFQDRKGDGYKIISFYAKRARGLMARFQIDQRIDQVDALRGFDLAGYRFVAEASEADIWVFRRDSVE
ncbi:peroxide stress protein YaaA [Parachitinimonas caeni]|uniref:UPF0246 protein PZA18_19800 n=1 Tax=Parachitinimonas caeni TaxID=3031301 RepID=A0ABT7E4K8_9NEIS|nr:peroxide stress protein YaaA [Parachitinimonas caeni]MDK2126293.1 peroxide stress protein YaaA [Parachitinimonas caeni]